MCRLAMLTLLYTSIASPVIVDRIAIEIGNSIIKDSDIDRDLRVTDFLNGDPLNFGNPARKQAASRLIDQVFIRREIQIGDYPEASWTQTQKQLDNLVRRKFKTGAAFEQALRRYGIAAVDLRTQLQWQLTILTFIEIRFKPAVLVTDQDIEKFYNQHTAELQRTHPGHAALDDLREQIRNRIVEERVNQQFFAWIDSQRKNNKIEYREADLR